MNKFKSQLTLMLIVCASILIKAETIVLNDTVSGMWTKANSPYIILRNIKIPENKTLMVEPGVEIQFVTGTGLEVYGNLQAIGTDVEKIHFTATDSTEVEMDITLGWNGITVSGEYADTCVFENCIINYVYNNAAINIGDRAAIINKCTIYKISGYYAGGIRCSNADILVQRCFIKGTAGNYSNVGGINIQNSKAIILNNLVINNSINIFVYGINENSDTVNIYNNTIVQTDEFTGSLGNIVIYDALVNIRNSIISGKINADNYYPWLVRTNNSPHILFKNCLVEGGTSTIEINNSFVTLENVYSANPAYINQTNNNFQLTDGSSAINSGATLSPGMLSSMPFDLNGNARVFDGSVDKIDIGAYEFQGDVTVNRPPIINNPGTQHVFVSSSKEMVFSFSDVDESDNHTLKVTADDPNISLGPLSAQANNALYTINPLSGWRGTANIILSVTDNHGAQDVDTFNIIVNDTVNYDITENTVWDIDTVYIGNSFTIRSGATLEIIPGTNILFKANYSVLVDGIIIANGTVDKKIKFTLADTSGFSNNTHYGWGGLQLMNFKDTSVFNNCIFEYAKDHCVFYMGGNANVRILNTIIRYNSSSEYYTEPSVISGNKSNLYIGNTVFHDNKSRYATIFLDEPEINLLNNIFYNNSAIFATLYFRNGGNSLIKNCIFWNNNNRDWEIEATNQVGSEITNCIVEKGEGSITSYGTTIINNEFIYGIYPQFTDTLNRDFHLLPSSPCINTGVNDVQLAHLYNKDLDGNSRIYNGIAGIPDIGAYEYQGNPSNRAPVLELVEDKTTMLENSVTGTVIFFDADETNTHTVTITSSDVNVTVQNLSGDTTGSVYTLMPSAGFEGNVEILTVVQDNGGLSDTISYNLQVSQTACGTIYDDMVWDADTINVDCEVVVEKGATLTIMPGTKVLFDGTSSLIVNGVLKAIGDINDTILFTNSSGGTFNGIKILSDEGQGASELKYCEISNSQTSGIKLGYYALAVISNCNIHHNTSTGYGGAIYSQAENLLIENNNIHHNQCNDYGGAIYIAGVSEIINNTISNNIARNAGGIYTYATGTLIKGNIIENNVASGTYSGLGGGISSEGIDTISNNIIIGNNADRLGGGIMARNSIIINNTIQHNNTISTNTTYGGGICLSTGSSVLINNLVTGNNSGNGGGIYIGSNKASIINNTIAKNKSLLKGPAMFIEGNSSPELKNNIIWGNIPSVASGQIHLYSNTSKPNISFCVIQDGINGIGAEYANFTKGVYENNINRDPYFSDSANNDFTLTDSSICINNGTIDTAGLKIPVIDIAGNARIFNGNINRIDIGAYEHNGEPVNRQPILNYMPDVQLFTSQSKLMKVEYSDSDNGDTHTITIEPNNPNLTINNISGDTTRSTYNIVAQSGWEGSAIIKVKVVDLGGLADSAFYTVNVSNNVCGTIVENTVWDTDSVFVDCDLTISAGKTLTIMPGTVIVFNGSYRFLIYGTLIAEGTQINKITFVSGDTTAAHPNHHRGAMYFYSNSVTTDSSKLTHCTIKYAWNFTIMSDKVKVSECNFNNCYSSNGGGIYILNSSPTVQNSVFSNNSVSNTGGGISITDQDDFDYIYTNPIIKGNRFVSNTASHGGGIYCSGWNTKPRIENNIFYNNHATYGGGIYLGDDVRDIIIQNNLIFKNTASYNGAGIYFENYSQVLINNTIAKNTALNNGGGLYFQGFSSSSIYNTVIFYNKALKSGSQVYIDNNGCDPGFYNCFLQYGKDSLSGPGAGNEFNGNFKNVLTADPLFVDTANYNYQLSDSSFCINAGTMNIKNTSLPLKDISGNPRVFAGFLSNVDVGAYEYQGNPKNRKPIIVATKDQYTQVSTPRNLSVNFTDVDKTDVHTITITTNTTNVTVENKSGNVSGSNYELVPANGWEGIAEIYIRVEDDKNNYALDTFNLTVSQFYCGSIAENTVWDADTIKVLCDITVEEDVTLTILPGTVVEFDNYSSLNVSGRLVAAGTKENRIIFTSSDTTDYLNNNYIGWRGIRFYGPGSTDTSRLIYCTIKYAKGREINYTSDQNGGGLFFDDWNQAIVANCLIYNNSALESGGGIYFQGGGMSGSSSHVQFENNIISNNRANSGGGIYSNMGNINPYYTCFKNNIISNNSASNYGGGMYCNGMYSFNNTVVNNSANYGGGLYLNNNSSTIINSVFWGNVASLNSSTDQIGNLSVQYLTLCNNIIEDGLNGISAQIVIDRNENLIAQNPEFVSPALGAGYTFNGLAADWSLFINSPCINKGSVNAVTNFEYLPADITGEERIMMDTIDIGAYEYHNYAPVKSNSIADVVKTATLPVSISISNEGIFTDMNPGDILKYEVSAVENVDWMSLGISENNINIDGTPGIIDTGTVQIIVSATDLFGGSNSDTFNLIIKVNSQPVLQNKIPDIVVDIFENFSYTIPVNCFTDPDVDDVLSYSATLENGDDLPGWLGFNSESRTFSGIPQINDVGIYMVIVEVSDEIGAACSDTFLITVPGGVFITNMRDNLFNIYPVPAKETLNIECLNKIGDNKVMIEIYDFNGKRILSQERFNENIVKIDINSFPTGIYYLKLHYNNEIKSYKIPIL